MTRAREFADLAGSADAGGLTGRNLLINGAMQVAQRSTSETGLTSGTFATMDRFRVSNTGRDEHVYTEAQVSDAPDGFVNSFKVTTTTAETSIDANDGFWVQHAIEAQNLQHLQNGSSGALSTTLSFYVKSSQTGTFGVNLYKADNTARVINSTYTISSADTWEYKTITFAGDTAGGGIDDNNGEGLRVVWHLAAGSNYDSVNSTSWANYSTTNWAGGHAQDGVITTANATWQLTGVQLEVGERATPFEHRSFGDELRRCQRYYYKITPGDTGGIGTGIHNTTSQATVFIPYQVAMREGPTAVESSSTATDFDIRNNNSVIQLNAVPAFQAATRHGAEVLYLVEAQRKAKLLLLDLEQLAIL